MIFLQSIYQFTTFKIIPETLMDDILIKLGFKDSGETDIIMNTSRRLEETEVSASNFETMGYTSDSGILENLNTILFGALGLGILIVIVLICKALSKRFAFFKFGLETLTNFIFTSIH